MDFPNNKQEILDKVVSVAIDFNLDEVKRDMQTRLALVHWKFVEDQKEPNIKLDGVNLDLDTPSMAYDIDAIQKDAGNYMVARGAELKKDYRKALEASVLVSDAVGFDSAKKSIELDNKVTDIAKRLKEIGEKIIDTKITVSMSDEFTDHLRKMEHGVKGGFTGKYPGLPSGSDVKFHAEDPNYRDNSMLVIHTSESLSGTILSRLKGLAPELDEHIIVKTEAVPERVPKLKDWVDLRNVMKKEKALNESSLEPSM